jgi:hypothetical protein
MDQYGQSCEWLLRLTRTQAAPPGAAQAGFFEAPPGPVHAGSPAAAKVALFGALFAARADVHAVRWENARTRKAGWCPPWHPRVRSPHRSSTAPVTATSIPRSNASMSERETHCVSPSSSNWMVPGTLLMCR